MKRRSFALAGFFLALAVFIAAPAFARGVAGYGPREQAEDDRFLENEDLARIAFVQADEDGTELIFIRLPPGMLRFAKARAKVKRRGLVRVALRPRHYLAIENATGKLPARVVLRLDARRFKSAKGAKSHYVVRPLSQFMRDDPSDVPGDTEE